MGNMDLTEQGGPARPPFATCKMGIVLNGVLPEGRESDSWRASASSIRVWIQTSSPPSTRIHAFHKLFLSTFCVPEPVSETGLAPSLRGSHSSEGDSELDWARGARERSPVLEVGSGRASRKRGHLS